MAVFSLLGQGAAEPHRRPHLLLTFLSLVLAVLLHASGLLRDQERILDNGIYSLFERSASGQLVIVEIDGKSLSELDQWPWPRGYHAELIRRLEALDAQMIAFDVDFSAVSKPDEDAAFAGALANAKLPVILPTFSQRSSSDSSDFIDSLPTAVLRDKAMLASVNVYPDERGQLDQVPMATRTDGVVRPGLAAMLADGRGTLNESITVDPAINPKTIPRLSYVDVLRGEVLPESVAGRRMLIGATALELGDHFSTARHGVLPGVVIQALAAESLIAGVSSARGPWIPLIIVALFLLYWRRTQGHSRASHFRGLAIGIALTFALALTMNSIDLGHVQILPAIVALLAYFGIGWARDMKASQRSERLIDAGTGLPNQRALVEKLAADPHSGVALLHLSNFESLSVIARDHAIPAIFAEIAARLRDIIGQKKLYRISDNCLAWMMADMSSDHKDRLFKSCAAVLGAPVAVGEQSVRLQCHFGFAQPNEEAQDMVEHARTAGRVAKKENLLWTDHSEAAIASENFRQRILVDIDAAMARDEFWVAYQPQLSLSTNRIAGAEALIRWDHPELGPLRPDVFIPVMEEQGRINEVTLYMLTRVLDAVELWNENGLCIGCAINISASLLPDSVFIDRAIAMVSERGLPKDSMTFEITETAALKDPDEAASVLKEIRAAGIRISIDDYGTGQSTLSYLSKFPATEIKIDRSFVAMAAEREAERILVRSSIELAQALGFETVAEGIEDQQTLDLLRDLGCGLAQGWHIGKPVRLAEFNELWIAGNTEMMAAQ